MFVISIIFDDFVSYIGRRPFTQLPDLVGAAAPYLSGAEVF
jgi:hypothetical protein